MHVLQIKYLGFGIHIFGRYIFGIWQIHVWQSVSTTEEFMAGPFLVERCHIQVKVFPFFLTFGYIKGAYRKKYDII